MSTPPTAMERQRATPALTRKLAALALGLPLGMACTEGYPTDDVVSLHASEMTRTQLLQAMNDIGANAVPGRAWRYSLAAGCTLRVTRRQPGHGAGEATVALAGLTTKTSVDRESKLHGLRLRPQGDQGSEPVLVVESRRWTDPLKMASLLQALEARCGDLD